MALNKGALAAVGAYVMWGLFPIYWKLLEAVPALQILAHRMVWSLVFLAGVLALRKDWGWLGTTLRDWKTLRVFVLAAALLSVNWYTYIWAVNNGYIVESSLGYFINPLVSVVLGVVFLREQLRRAQLAAVLLAGIGVFYLTLEYGRPPWIALVLALTFGLYGLLKKTAPLGSVKGLTLEMAAMFIPAFSYLLLQDGAGTGAFGHLGAQTTALLALAGAVTAVPLLMFGWAAQHIPLTMVGILQYIAPTMQFLIGVFLYGEAFPLTRLVGFSIIWAALVLYSLEGVVSHRRAMGAPAVELQ